MSVRKTILIGDPVLRWSAKNVPDIFDTGVQELIADLTDTMRDCDLIGISAPQAGESLAIFVSEIRETEFRKDEFDELRVYINPKIIDVSHETELGWEGCGSIPELFGKVERSKELIIEYSDEKGKKQTKSCSGLLARVVQHEIDHLNGILFTDLADPKTLVSREHYLNVIRKEE